MHPFHRHNEHKKSHERVGHILKHEPKDQQRHDGKAFSHHVRSKSAAVAHEHKVAGKKKPGRYARGGKVKGHQTNIAIVVPHRSPSPTPAGPQAGAAPPIPPMAAAPAPMAPPPPGMPMRARGGKVIDGEATAGNIGKWGRRAAKNSYARGGRLPSAGAQTGVARLQQAHARGHR